jgi:Fe-S-cluster containining protein
MISRAATTYHLLYQDYNMNYQSADLGCARCGDCCQDITLSVALESLTPWTSGALASTPDPGTEEGWLWWTDTQRPGAWSQDQREQAIAQYDPHGTRRRNADFLTEHWHESAPGQDGPLYACDRFDPDTRLCVAHEQRPPVCSGYPWYGRPPRPGVILNPRCSYLLDIAPPERPAGARPLIPIEVVTRHA